MAAPGKKKTEDSGIRINFRLNPNRPKERVILEFLRKHVENYDASRIIKQALYEMATGRSWIHNQAVTTSIQEESDDAPMMLRANEVLDDIVAGLDDWIDQ